MGNTTKLNNVPLLFHFKPESGDSLSITLAELSIESSKIKLLYAVKISELNSWEKDEMGDGWVAIKGQNGQVWENNIYHPAFTELTHNSTIAGYYNTVSREFEMYIDFNIMNIRANSPQQVLSTSTPSIVSSSKIVEIGKDGGDVQIDFYKEIDYKATIDKESLSWIHLKNSDSSNSSRTFAKLDNPSQHVCYTIDPSEEYEKREGKITFTYGSFSETVTIYQTGGAILILSSNNMNIGNEGGELDVVVSSNFDFGIDMPNVDWLTQEDTSNSRAVTSHTVKFKVTENPLFESRTASIRIYDKNSSLADTVYIEQAARTPLVAFVKDSVELNVGSNMALSVRNTTGQNVKFSSSDPSIVSVDANGCITGNKKGTATITVTTANGKYSGHCTVQVKDVEDDIKTYCSTAAIMSINGLIKYGSQFGWTIINNTSESVTLVSMQLVDGVTGKKSNEMSVGAELAAGESVTYTTTVGLLGIYEPVTCIFKFTTNGSPAKSFTKEAVYSSSK